MRIYRRAPSNQRHRTSTAAGRSGAILLVVLIVVVGLSIAAYSFTRRMVIDLAITKTRVHSIQQQLLADSVVEQLLASQRQALHSLCRAKANAIEGSRSAIPRIEVRSHSGVAFLNLPDGQVGYAAVLCNHPNSTTRHIGLSNESSKLNLNSLARKQVSRRQAIDKLIKYKDLSSSTAEGIVNVLGVFDSRGDLSTNSSTDQRSAPTTPPAGLTSIVQLLTVPGVTEERLLGEDRNANGILDWNEDDGDATWPPDDADGELDGGWSADWTIVGAESNYRADGQRKIDLNQKDLVALYDQLREFATLEEARFVVAWRVSSPVYTDISKVDEQANRKEAADELATSFDDRLAKQLGRAASNSTNEDSVEIRGRNPKDPRVRAGVDLDVRSPRRFRSLLDLAACQLQLIVDGKDTILVSPFANDPTSIARWLPLWEDRTSVTAGSHDISRINILQASLATLTTVDGVSDELAKAIVRQRASISLAGSADTTTPTSVAWLLEAGIVTSSQLRGIADEITVGGDVFQGYALGQLRTSHTAHARFFELDGRGPKLKVRRSIDLRPLPVSRRLQLVD